MAKKGFFISLSHRIQKTTILLTLFSAFWSQLYAQSRPVITTVNSTDWAQAQHTKLQSTLQVTFPTHIFDRKQDILSAIFAEIPKYFSHLKLNTIGRNLHSTLLYLDGLSLDDAREVALFFDSLDQKTLESHDLLRSVNVLDMQDIHLTVLGTQSKFLALQPHREFIQWQIRFLRLIQERAPRLFAKHVEKFRKRFASEQLSDTALMDRMFSGDSVHLSLVQWGERFGLPLTDAQVEDVKSTMHSLMQRVLHEFHSRSSQEPQLLFGLATHPLELVTAPVSIHGPPTPLLTFKVLNGNEPHLSPVGVFQIEEPETGYKRFLEFYTSQFMRNEAEPFEKQLPRESWIASSRRYDAYDLKKSEGFDFFANQLPASLRRVLQGVLSQLSPTRYPAPAGNGTLMVTAQTHPNLSPEKAQPILSFARRLGVHSTERVSLGHALYASAARVEIENPGDYDLILNSIVHVPQNINTYEDAEHFAAQAFIDDVLSQYIALAKKDEISFTELRVSSDYHLGFATGDPDRIMDALEEHPYLPQSQIFAGEFQIRTGQTVALADAISHGDFIKSKIDVYQKDQHQQLMRTRISLQFLVGFEWNGTMHYLQRNALKGVPPLMRTAVYDGPESYTVAAALSRAADLYAIQRGSPLPRAIRDVLKAAFGYNGHGPQTAPVVTDALSHAKFAKRFYNFLILLQRNGHDLDEYFLEQSRRILQKEGRWQEGFALDRFIKRLVSAINQPQLKLLSDVRNIVNDLREYNERGDVFTPHMWMTRSQELAEMLPRVRSQFDLPEGLQLTMNRFEEILNQARSKNIVNAIEWIHQSKYFEVYDTLEHQLLALEDQVIGSQNSHSSLTAFDRLFMQTVTSYAPHIFYAYRRDRYQDADSRTRWFLRAMGINGTDQNLKLMNSLSNQMHILNREDFGRLQLQLMRRDKTLAIVRYEDCKEALTAFR